jgi:REP element-mobilizing transposase RayT
MGYRERRSIRLNGYNYCSSGVYFVTICTQRKENTLGLIDNKIVILNEFGVVARDEWIKTAQIRTYVELDTFVIMPDHVHGILTIMNDVGATGSVAHKTLKREPVVQISLKPESLGSIIGQYKSVVTKRIHKMGLNNFQWQRNYYDRVIRNDAELFAIRKYILNNPVNHQINETL